MVAAVVAPLLAVPTAILLIRMERRPAGRRRAPEKARDASLRAALRHPGAREVLLAQILWVAGYVALPVFFVLYADRVLDLGAGAAAGMLAAFGILTGAAMVVAGRARPERVFPLLVLGAALLGGGLVAAAPAGSAAAAALPFACAAVGAGLVTALGFPYFARFVPQAEAGSYSGLYFSVRAIAATVAVPLAGVLIELTGSYRALMAQGAFALLALAPLALARAAARRPRTARHGRSRSASRRWCRATAPRVPRRSCTASFRTSTRSSWWTTARPRPMPRCSRAIGDWPRVRLRAARRERGQGRRRRRRRGRPLTRDAPAPAARRADRRGRRRPAPAGPNPRVRRGRRPSSTS